MPDLSRYKRLFCAGILPALAACGASPAPLGETGVDEGAAKRLVALANKIRALEAVGLAQPPSTRLLVHAAWLIRSGMPTRAAAHAALVEPLSDDPEVIRGLDDLVALAF